MSDKTTVTEVLVNPVFDVLPCAFDQCSIVLLRVSHPSIGEVDFWVSKAHAYVTGAALFEAAKAIMPDTNAIN